jgi:hypothetical protein
MLVMPSMRRRRPAAGGGSTGGGSTGGGCARNGCG